MRIGLRFDKIWPPYLFLIGRSVPCLQHLGYLFFTHGKLWMEEFMLARKFSSHLAVILYGLGFFLLFRPKLLCIIFCRHFMEHGWYRTTLLRVSSYISLVICLSSHCGILNVTTNTTFTIYVVTLYLKPNNRVETMGHVSWDILILFYTRCYLIPLLCVHYDILFLTVLYT